MEVREETEDGTLKIFVTHFDLQEEFSIHLIAQSYRQYLRIEHGCIVIHASNGTWWYQIEYVSFNGLSLVAELLRYERMTEGEI